MFLSAASSAARPPPSTSTVSNDWSSCAANSFSADWKSGSTDSVMRSCSSDAHCARSLSCRLPETYTAMPRSMRSTPSKPQLCTMSVALDDQGEIVPMRGVTKNKCRPSETCGTFSTRSASNKACIFSTAAPSKSAALCTKYQNSLFKSACVKPNAAAFCNNFSTRKPERADTPRK